MQAFCDVAAQSAHAPRHFLVRGVQRQSPETPERLKILKAALEAGGHALCAPPDTGLEAIAAIHPPDYIAFLEGIHARWQAIEPGAAEVVPNVHPGRHGSSYPASPVGQAGWHMADTACPVGPSTFEAARRSAHCAEAAAMHVLDGARTAYALCRPPGHHAFADMAGGFCFFNNSAIAAAVLRRRHERVAILDVDLHHGNGTQGIFYARPDVMTVSIHADPDAFYPFFWGHAHERGEGAGEGTNLNLPLPLGTGDDGFLAALDGALERIALFAPGALVLALGLDAHGDDPFGGLAVTTRGFERIGRAVAGLGLPCAVVQEGGYVCDSLGDNLQAALEGLSAGAP